MKNFTLIFLILTAVGLKAQDDVYFVAGGILTGNLNIYDL